MLHLASLYAVAGFVCWVLRLKKLRKLFQEKERLQRKAYERHLKEIQKRIEEAEKLRKRIAEATPEELAAMWKAGKLDARDYNRLNPRKPVQKGLSPSEIVDPGIYVGPRGGRYRINSSGRKSYDVP